jgi:hypothetical protein
VDAVALRQEADRLARPCVYLRASGSEYAAVWTGSPATAFELTFSSAALPPPGWPRPGAFRLRGDRTRAAIDFVEGMVLPSEPDGLKLYAAPAISLPPIEGIFLLGSERVQEWLSSVGWSPHDGYRVGFPHRDVVEEYLQRYQDQLPLYAGGAHAVLGGWHLPWPDGDWWDLVPSQLLAWTFEGSEPWLEAWARDGALRVIRRIT